MEAMSFAPFVYGLVDPDEPTHVRYVGLAGVRASRPYDHAKWARSKRAIATWQVNWIRKVQAAGREPVVLVLEQLAEGASRRMLGFVEACYIKSLLKIGHRLTNVAVSENGGHDQTPETRTRISGSLKGRQKSDETRELLRLAWTDERRVATRKRQLGNTFALGRVQPEEEKQKRAISLLQHHAENPGAAVVSEEHRRKIAETLTGYKHTPEACANMGASRVGSKRTPEARANMSAAQTGKPKSEVCKKKIAETLTGRKQSAETCAKKNASVKATKSTPEARLDASIKAKAAWAKRKAAKGGVS